MIYRELRCRLCNKKLGNAAGTYRLAVKCPRCKHLNEFKAHQQPMSTIECLPRSAAERPRRHSDVRQSTAAFYRPKT